MRRNLAIAAALTLMFSVGTAMGGDTLYGTIHHKDGSKVKKTAAITTSWNRARGTYPTDGEYKIDFGGKVGQKITVYVNGDRYDEIVVKGDTRLNIQLRK